MVSATLQRRLKNLESYRRKVNRFTDVPYLEFVAAGPILKEAVALGLMTRERKQELCRRAPSVAKILLLELSHEEAS